MTGPGHDGYEIEALRTDRYLEALLAAGDRGATAVPADSAVDPAVRHAASRLVRDLLPVHPSFRFEERLAARLAEAARSAGLAAAAGSEALPAPIPLPARGRPDAPFDPLANPLGDPLDADLDPRLRPLLIGGALTSAALSLAGAAWVAWRRTRPPARGPMARAVRAARLARGPGIVRRLA